MQAGGDSEPDVKRRISKASQAFSMLKNIWKSKKLSRNTTIRIFRSNVVSVLLYGCESWKVATTISRIRYVIRMPSDAILKIALRWTPNAGRRRRGRPKETWRRSFEREMKENGLSWAQVEHLARNRGSWRSLVLALCATGHEED